MSTKMPTKTDRELFAEALELFNRPEEELRQRPLEADVDVEGFIDTAFVNITIPPI